MKFSVRKKGKLKLQAKDVIFTGSLSSSKAFNKLKPLGNQFIQSMKTNVTTKVEQNVILT